MKTLNKTAYIELCLCVFFALPPLFPFMLKMMEFVHEALGSHGQFPLLTSVGYLFAHLFGVFGVVWAIARIWIQDTRLVMLDNLIRVIFALLMVYYIWSRDLSYAIFIFVAFELLGVVYQTWFLQKEGRT